MIIVLHPHDTGNDVHSVAVVIVSGLTDRANAAASGGADHLVPCSTFAEAPGTSLLLTSTVRVAGFEPAQLCSLSAATLPVCPHPRTPHRTRTCTPLGTRT